MKHSVSNWNPHLRTLPMLYIRYLLKINIK